MPSSLALVALAPLMLFGAGPPVPRGDAETIRVSLCFGEAQVPIRIPRGGDDDPRHGATACHAAAVIPKKKRA